MIRKQVHLTLVLIFVFMVKLIINFTLGLMGGFHLVQINQQLLHQRLFLMVDFQYQKIVLWDLGKIGILASEVKLNIKFQEQLLVEN